MSEDKKSFEEKKETVSPEESSEIVPSETGLSTPGFRERFQDFFNSHKLLAVSLGIFAGVAIIYSVGVGYFQSHLLPNTYINGRQTGGKTVEEAVSILEYWENGELILHGIGEVEEKLDLSALPSRQEVAPEEVEQVQKAQSPYQWPFSFGKKEYEVPSSIVLDEEGLDTLLSQLNISKNAGKIPSKNAYITLGASGHELVPEVVGDAIDKEQLHNSVLEAVYTGQKELDLQEAGVYQPPELTTKSPELLKKMEELDQLSEYVLRIDLGGVEQEVPYDVFASWLELDQDYEVTVDKKAVEKYIEELAMETDTIGRRRSFRATAVGEITVGGGNYGWQMNIGATAKLAQEHLEERRKEPLIPIYISTARTRDYNDIGNTYIEIDLSAQTMWHYIDGELFVETGVVTGLPGTKRETPMGVFYVWSKETKRYLEGEDYKLWVEYWLPIDWTGVGIHDAPWQPAYGGTQYWVSGSHGCINTPPALAAEIYANVELGTPVIIYKS